MPRDDPLNIAVNLSAGQLRDGPAFVDKVQEILARTGLSAAHLELEITESMLVQHVEANIATLRSLAAGGVRIAVDDFGTGYSSLSYLKRLPIHGIKIDSSFVRDVVADADNAAIVRAVVSLGRSLQLAVTAEGIESREQLDALRALDCEMWQGYLFGAAVPADEFRRRHLTAVVPAKVSGDDTFAHLVVPAEAEPSVVDVTPLGPRVRGDDKLQQLRVRRSREGGNLASLRQRTGSPRSRGRQTRHRRSRGSGNLASLTSLGPRLRGDDTFALGRMRHFGAIRIAPSRRITSPFSIGLRRSRAPATRTPSGLPSRGGNGTILPSASCTSGVRLAIIGVSKMPGAMVITRMP